MARCADRVPDTGCRRGCLRASRRVRALGAPGRHETPAPLSSLPSPLAFQTAPRASVQVAPQTHRFQGARKDKRKKKRRGKKNIGLESDISCIACRGLQEKPGREGARAGRRRRRSPGALRPQPGLPASALASLPRGNPEDGSLSPRLSRPTRSRSHWPAERRRPGGRGRRRVTAAGTSGRGPR